MLITVRDQITHLINLFNEGIGSSIRVIYNPLYKIVSKIKPYDYKQGNYKPCIPKGIYHKRHDKNRSNIFLPR